MKKVLALVLALVMVLTAAAALADGAQSPVGPTPGGEVTPVVPATDTTGGTTTDTATTTNNAATQPYWTTVPAVAPVTMSMFDTDPEEVQAFISDVKNNGLSGLPADILAKIAGFDTISDAVSSKFEGDVTAVKTGLEATISFKSALPANEDVKALIVIFANQISYEVLDGKTTADGKLKVVLPNELVKKIGSNVFAVFALTKSK
jgi:hypothetical protein